MKHLLIMSALLISIGQAEARSKVKRSPKLSRVDAKELCLTTKGSAISKKELKKCISKAMRTGKV